jgi:hypothetical protein
MEVITGGIMQAYYLFPTNRLELPGFLLIHKFASLATAFRPVLLAHRLGFKLAALSLVAVPRTVRRHGNYSLKWSPRRVANAQFLAMPWNPSADYGCPLQASS